MMARSRNWTNLGSVAFGLVFVVGASSFWGCGELFDNFEELLVPICKGDGNMCVEPTCDKNGFVIKEEFKPSGAYCEFANNPDNAGQCNDAHRCVPDCLREIQNRPTCTCDPLNSAILEEFQNPGDCQEIVCNGGTLGIASDIDDVPMANECEDVACVDGKPETKKSMFGTPCATGVCDGNGTCLTCLSVMDLAKCGANCPAKLCEREGCKANSECQNNRCVDGYCCDTPCTEECKSCRIAGAEGVCTNVGFYDEDPQYIDPQKGSKTCLKDDYVLCNGTGKCLTPVNSLCTFNSDCMSNVCVDVMNGDDYCKGAPGEPCAGGATICASGTCMSGKCT